MSTNNVPVGDPQTGYSINANDLVKVELEGQDQFRDDDDIKSVIKKIKDLKIKATGACYRLNTILQQINARISSTQSSNTTIASAAGELYVTFVFPFPVLGGNTNPVILLSSTYTPSSARMAVKVVAVSGTTQVDIQYSKDSGSTWTTLLQSGYVTVTAGSNEGLTVSLFSSVSLSSGDMLRGSMPGTSSSGASGITVSLRMTKS